MSDDTYSDGVSVNGYRTNGATPPQPMVHVIGREYGEVQSLCLSPADARLVAKKMIEFADRIDADNENMEWKL